MSQQLKLAAQNRTLSGRNAVKKVKAAGFVPAVIYGDKNQPQNLQIAIRDINALMAHASSENILVDLEISDGPNKISRLALIHEVQHHPVGRQVLHVDFQAVSATETLTASVPVEPVGEANGVKNFGGLLSQNLHEIELECLPKDLPESLQVDVSGLNIGDSIHVRDLVLPAGVTSTLDPDLTVFAVAEPLVAEEPAAGAAATPEVLKEKKPEAAAAAPAKK
ncbi:MAG TPA: 50S ribosomal protein L25 [Chthoniobacterales bacterium]|jgi:large subunit ribosomal protein L25